MIGENKYANYKPNFNELGNFNSMRNSQKPSFDKSAPKFTNDFKFGQFAKNQLLSPLNQAGLKTDNNEPRI